MLCSALPLWRGCKVLLPDPAGRAPPADLSVSQWNELHCVTFLIPVPWVQKSRKVRVTISGAQISHFISTWLLKKFCFAFWKEVDNTIVTLQYTLLNTTIPKCRKKLIIDTVTLFLTFILPFPTPSLSHPSWIPKICRRHTQLDLRKLYAYMGCGY